MSASISRLRDRSTSEPTVTGTIASVVAPPRQTMRMATVSRAVRWMTTLSMRQRRSAFLRAVVRAGCCHRAGRRRTTSAKEGREDQLETRLHLAIRVLDHHAADLPHEAGGQDQCKLTAGCLVQETRREARPNGVQLDFGDRALEPEQQASIRGARIIDTVSVGDQTILVAAEIEQRIPVRAIACQTRDLGGEHDTDLSKRNARDQVLEPLPVVGGGTAQSEIGVDDLDVLVTPPKAESAPAQIVLQPQALLVRQHLVRAGLANIDDRAPGEMPVGDELRSHGSPPRGSRRGSGRSRRGV